MSEPEILDPSELIGGVVLRAQETNTTAGETVVQIRLIRTDYDSLRCRRCGCSTHIEDMDGPVLSVESKGWESHYFYHVRFEDGRLFADHDYSDGPDETEPTGKGEVRCYSCGHFHDFEGLDPESLGRAILEVFEPYASEDDDE